MHNSNKLFLLCSCYGEGLLVEAENDPEWTQEGGPPEFSLAIFKRGLQPYHMTFWDKMRWICHILRHNAPYSDEILLSKESALELAEFILRQYRVSKKSVN